MPSIRRAYTPLPFLTGTLEVPRAQLTQLRQTTSTAKMNGPKIRPRKTPKMMITYPTTPTPAHPTMKTTLTTVSGPDASHSPAKFPDGSSVTSAKPRPTSRARPLHHPLLITTTTRTAMTHRSLPPTTSSVPTAAATIPPLRVPPLTPDAYVTHASSRAITPSPSQTTSTTFSGSAP
jgi:hypothetical protein